MKTIRRVIPPTKGTVLGLLKKYWVVIPGIVIVGLLIWVVFGVYVQGRGWADWTGFGKYTASTSSTGSTTTTVVNYRTLWDLLDLLIIPIVLAIGAWALNKTEREAERKAAEKRAKTDRKIALDRQRQDTLQAYYDRMTDLLLKEGLSDASEDSPVRDVARAQTLTTLGSLDKSRKRQVIQFLYEAKLIHKGSVKVSLEGANLWKVHLGFVNLLNVDLHGAMLTESYLARADLSNANLIGADFGKANLRGARLSGVDLRGAYLGGAQLGKAVLICAEMERAYLQGADLQDADLVGANLEGAELQAADLRGARLADLHPIPNNPKDSVQVKANLKKAKYDAKTQWPEGFDPEAAGVILVESEQ